MTDRVLRHHEGGIKSAGVLVHGHRIGCHDRAKRPVERDVPEHDTVEHIALGQYAGDLAVVADRDDRSDALIAHAGERVAQTGAGSARDRRLAQQGGQQAGHVVACMGVLTCGLAGQAQRLLQQVGEAARAKIGELRTSPKQVIEVILDPLVAEGIDGSDVIAYYRAIFDEGAQGKAFAGQERVDTVSVAGLLPLRHDAHLAAQDHMEHARRAIAAAEKARALRMVVEPRLRA